MAEEQEPGTSQNHSGGAAAAGSLGAFFQKIHWDIISFFPNSPCVKKKKIKKLDK